VNDMVNIKLSKALQFRVSVTNLLGQEVQSDKNFKTNHLLDVSQLKAGIYVLTISTQNANSQSIKFIKN
ncbi:MAG: T9SS type A sorting domain-containing protein, partial [Winogradskyella sp.]|nr:T9SS type A sorting domain-containing protein [Winogradskyella sp.]